MLENRLISSSVFLSSQSVIEYYICFNALGKFWLFSAGRKRAGIIQKLLVYIFIFLVHYYFPALYISGRSYIYSGSLYNEL